MIQNINPSSLRTTRGQKNTTVNVKTWIGQRKFSNLNPTELVWNELNRKLKENIQTFAETFARHLDQKETFFRISIFSSAVESVNNG